MSEQNHSPENQEPEPTPPVQPSQQSWTNYIAGTVVLLVVAGICFQFFRASTGSAQSEKASNGQGRASLYGTSGKVLAKVNNQSITYDVVARYSVERHGEEVLDNLINRLIIQQECDRQGITIKSGEVEREVAETAEKFNLPVDTWYQMLASERGLTREQYHNDVIWPMIALKKLAGKSIQVTEKEMQEGFERDYGPRVKARMILINGNLHQATAIWNKCDAAPEEFGRIAREHSADSNSRPLDGVIPPIRKHGGSPTVEEEAFKLRTGEISALIALADSSYVILKCEGRTEPVVDDIRVVWNDLLEQLTEQQTQKSVAQVFKKIRDEAHIDNFLTRTTTAGRSPIQRAAALQPITK